MWGASSTGHGTRVCLQHWQLHSLQLSHQGSRILASVTCLGGFSSNSAVTKDLCSFSMATVTNNNNKFDGFKWPNFVILQFRRQKSEMVRPSLWLGCHSFWREWRESFSLTTQFSRGFLISWPLFLLQSPQCRPWDSWLPLPCLFHLFFFFCLSLLRTHVITMSSPRKSRMVSPSQNS